MSQAARVTSIDAIEEFKAAWCRFGTDAGNALANLDLQIRRAFDWLDDQAKFWKTEIRRREELVVRAKGELLQRKYGNRDGRGPGTTDQEIALEKAQAQLHEAETKLRNCKHWSQILPREVMECEGPARFLTGMLESEYRQALAVLEQKILALEAYVALAPPSGAGSVSGESSPDATAAAAPAAENAPKEGTAG
jgi:hypothetical protein